MDFLILLAVAAAIFFFWQQNKAKKTQEAVNILQRLDELGEIEGKPISDLQSILGSPSLRKASDVDPNIVQWMWYIGKVCIVVNWDKMDKNETIVTFLRSDRL